MTHLNWIKWPTLALVAVGLSALPSQAQDAAGPGAPAAAAKSAGQPPAKKSNPTATAIEPEVLPWATTPAEGGAPQAAAPAPEAPGKSGGAASGKQAKSAPATCEGAFEAACRETDGCAWMAEAQHGDGSVKPAQCLKKTVPGKAAKKATPKKPEETSEKPKASLEAPNEPANKPAAVAPKFEKQVAKPVTPAPSESTSAPSAAASPGNAAVKTAAPLKVAPPADTPAKPSFVATTPSPSSAPTNATEGIPKPATSPSKTAATEPEKSDKADKNASAPGGPAADGTRPVAATAADRPPMTAPNMFDAQGITVTVPPSP